MYCGRGDVTGLELAEVELVASDAEVFDDIRDDAAGHIAGMPGKGDEPVGSERIGVVPVAARCAEQFAADFPEPPLGLRFPMRPPRPRCRRLRTKWMS